MITLAQTCFLAVATVACVSGQRYEYDAPAQQEERAPRYIASASDAKPTPVPILKQVNRHNEDGSYTYGYESADGSFKIETKLANGEVKGKYGYKDDTGKVRTIEYGANKYGFQPSGEGITVAPPTLVDESAQQERGADRQGQQFPSSGGRAQYGPAAPAQPAPVDYDYEEAAPAPTPAPYRAPAARAPAPPRPPKPAFFAGAAPAPAEQSRAQPQQNDHFRAAPPPQGVTYARAASAPGGAQPHFQYSQNIDFSSNQFQPQQQQQFSAPAPRKQYEAQQFSAPAPAYNQGPLFQPGPQNNFNSPQPRQQPFSMLDQLIKEYGLPQGGSAPLHDITFGSY